MNKAVPVGVGVGIGLVALAIIFLVPGQIDEIEDNSSMEVQLTDQIEVVSEESKSFEVTISEGVQVGDGSP